MNPTTGAVSRVLALPAKLAQFGSLPSSVGVKRICAYCTALALLNGGTLIIDRDR